VPEKNTMAYAIQQVHSHGWVIDMPVLDLSFVTCYKAKFVAKY
jgi:hypothetical protein